MVPISESRNPIARNYAEPPNVNLISSHFSYMQPK